MNKKENAGAFLCTDEERLLISRAAELSARTEDSAAALSFLTPREQALIYAELERRGVAHRLFFWGGFVGAQRRKAVFLPAWLEGDYPRGISVFSEERERYFIDLLTFSGMESLLTDFLCAVKLCPGGFRDAPNHRDYLGSLMALGLKRSVIGDICICDGYAVVFCEETAATLITAELRSAGRESLKSEMFPVDRDFAPVVRFEEICTTVASLRLDGVVRALCNVSRDEAAQLVSKGMVDVNYFTKKETDLQIKGGDIISVRGFGKFIIDGDGGETRRQRLRLLARKYV
ncbi:MAG: hypothetical protein IKL24_05870 [Clostridia bacterium]|nr:hypothetical protein [Clostridia bacterium]